MHTTAKKDQKSRLIKVGPWNEERLIALSLAAIFKEVNLGKLKLSAEKLELLHKMQDGIEGRYNLRALPEIYYMPKTNVISADGIATFKFKGKTLTVTSAVNRIAANVVTETINHLPINMDKEHTQNYCLAARRNGYLVTSSIAMGNLIITDTVDKTVFGNSEREYFQIEPAPERWDNTVMSDIQVGMSMLTTFGKITRTVTLAGTDYKNFDFSRTVSLK